MSSIDGFLIIFVKITFGSNNFLILKNKLCIYFLEANFDPFFFLSFLFYYFNLCFLSTFKVIVKCNQLYFVMEDFVSKVVLMKKNTFALISCKISKFQTF